MPRIPLRTEPYTSPSRQHRHYKNKRDQVLRALGKAAYINGSHFAIMWVSARGDVETYASEALQSRLDDWFGKRGISDEAKELVRASRGSIKRAPPIFDGEDDDEDVEEDDAGAMSDEEMRGGQGRLSQARSAQHSTTTTPNLAGGDDVFTDVGQRLALQAQQAKLDARPKLERGFSTPLGSNSAGTSNLSIRSRRGIAPLDMNVGSIQADRSSSMLGTGPHTAVGGSHLQGHFAFEGLASPFGEVPHSAPLRSIPLPGLDIKTPLGRSSSTTDIGQQTSSLVETTFKTAAARTAFLELRFGQLQQGMCKTVAKAWIKIIEPKKQTRCPYNKGEDGKPEWWPEGVRHKEPDHLMKPERHALLLTILRSPKIKVARLQLATAEVVALIKADKVSLLMDIYRVAREEEKMREACIDVEIATTIAVSTLGGWSEADQCIIPTERAGSPSEEEQNPGPSINVSAGGDSSTRKRTAASIIRSASTSNLARPAKRLMPDGMPSSSNAAGTSMAGSRRSQGNAQTWLLHEATQHGIKRTSVSSHPLPSSTVPLHQPLAAIDSGMANGAAQQHQPNQHLMPGTAQPGLQRNHGLITPVTGDTHLMDPSFLAAAKEDEFASLHGGDQRFAGYMSAPTTHAQLFPHGPFGASQPQYYNLHATRTNGQSHQHTNASTSAHQMFNVQQQQQLDSSFYGSNHAESSNGSALGLHGIGIQWNAGPAFPTGFGGADADSSNWWSAQMAKGANGSHTGTADASFDTSFASTADSTGPATPPGGVSQHSLVAHTNLKAGAATGNMLGSNTRDFLASHQAHQHGQQSNQFQNGAQGRPSHYNLSLGKELSGAQTQQHGNSAIQAAAAAGFENWMYASQAQ